MLEIATTINNLKALLGALPNPLADLTTGTKSTLVGAINEIDAAVDALAASASGIDDAVTASDSTWSSVKIAAQITADLSTAITDLVDGAPDALNTVNELAAALQANVADITTILTALANRVRTDTAAQGLTTTQQSNARTNIGAASAEDVGSTTTDYAAIFLAALS